MSLQNSPTALIEQKQAKRLRVRRGGTLLWAVAALGLAAAMTPLFVSLCGSLCRLTARGGYRLIATQRGSAELDRLRQAGSAAKPGEFSVLELPSGRGTVNFSPGSDEKLRKAEVQLSWLEQGRPARATWTTLINR